MGPVAYQILFFIDEIRLVWWSNHQKKALEMVLSQIEMVQVHLHIYT
jgi:hypothetical protein